MPSLSQIAAKRDDFTFLFGGQEFTITYRTDKVTREFRAEVMRLNRVIMRSQKRSERLLAAVTSVEAEDGSEAAKAEDAAAEAAIEALFAEDDKLKREIDELIVGVVIKWDLTYDNGKMIPLTKEALFEVPAEFEGALMAEILKVAGMGEASGATSPNS